MTDTSTLNALKTVASHNLTVVLKAAAPVAAWVVSHEWQEGSEDNAYAVAVFIGADAEAQANAYADLEARDLHLGRGEWQGIAKRCYRYMQNHPDELDEDEDEGEWDVDVNVHRVTVNPKFRKLRVPKRKAVPA